MTSTATVQALNASSPGPSGKSELVVDLLDVAFDGAFRDEELPRDLTVGVPSRDQLGNLALPTAQLHSLFELHATCTYVLARCQGDPASKNTY